MIHINGFVQFFTKYDNDRYVLDKEVSIRTYKAYMITRLLSMFKYNGLPDSIPQDQLERILLTNGHCCITEVKGRLYALQGTWGGEPDVYYRPTRYIVANPALDLSRDMEMWSLEGEPKDECVLMRNDELWLGLNPIMSRYAYLLSENLITLRVVDIVLRALIMLSAPDDKTKASAEIYLSQLADGKIGVIGENRFFEGIKMQSPPSNNGSYLTQFIELHQYYLGSFYNEIGLSAQYNMKREAINEAEAAINEDILLPLIESMLRVRKEDVSRLNELYDLNVSVEFNSVWKENMEERKAILEQLKEGEDNAQQSNNNDSGEPNDSDSTDGTGDTAGEVPKDEGDDGTISDASGHDAGGTPSEPEPQHSVGTSDGQTSDNSTQIDDNGEGSDDVPDSDGDGTGDGEGLPVDVDVDVTININDSSQLEPEGKEDDDNVDDKPKEDTSDT